MGCDRCNAVCDCDWQVRCTLGVWQVQWCVTVNDRWGVHMGCDMTGATRCVTVIDRWGVHLGWQWWRSAWWWFDQRHSEAKTCRRSARSVFQSLCHACFHLSHTTIQTSYAAGLKRHRLISFKFIVRQLWLTRGVFIVQLFECIDTCSSVAPHTQICFHHFSHRINVCFIRPI